ncbi:hypothetical protein ACFQ60_19850 [Streptomyces zhihengii]
MGASTAIGNGDICRIHPPAGSSVEEVRVTWEMSADEPQGAGAPRFTPLPMGERAGAATDGAYVAFACTGGDLPGDSTRHLRVVVQKGGMPVVPDGDERGLREAYATVAHSFARALAGRSAAGARSCRPSRRWHRGGRRALARPGDPLGRVRREIHFLHGRNGLELHRDRGFAAIRCAKA